MIIIKIILIKIDNNELYIEVYNDLEYFREIRLENEI